MHTNRWQQTKHEANSVEFLHREIIALQNDIRKQDENEAIKGGRTGRNDFGYIHRQLISDNELSIPFIDQPMAMLYHLYAKNDILFIDATGSLVRQNKRYKRILYYAAVIRHPFDLSPPIPVAELITSNHDRFSIRRFLSAIHEKECHKYGNKEKTNPKLIMLDFSWALIEASLDECCGEETNDYSNRTHRVITGKATNGDLNKSLLHICVYHVIQMRRRNARRP